MFHELTLGLPGGPRLTINELLPPQIAGFRLLGVLGQGAAGTVYLAEQESLERQVALKVLHAQFDLPTIHARFRREAQLLGDIHHPNIIRFLGYGKSPQAYLVMEYLSGGTLKDRIKESQDRSRAGIGPTLSLVLARELLSALEALHQAGLVHRDVKPGNILFRDSGEAVLGDLGLVGQISPDRTRLTGAGDILGTLPYMAPELLSGGDHSIRSDLFSMGVTLYEAVTGTHPTGYGPFPAGFKPEDPSKICSECPRMLGELIRSLMDPDPDHRPRSAASALARMLQRSTASIQTTVRHQRPVALTWLAGGALAASAVAIGLWLLPGKRPRPAPTAPALEVNVHARHVRIRMAGIVPGTFVCLFDRKGKVVRGVDGEPQGSATVFDAGELPAGTSYTAAAFRRDAGAESTAQSEVTFRIPPRITVHGLETGRGEPALWISAEPECRVSWIGGRVRLVARPSGTRIPLEAAEKMRVEIDGEKEITLTFPGLVKLAASTKLDIGVRLDHKALTFIEDDEAKLRTQKWLERFDIHLVSIRADSRGVPPHLDVVSTEAVVGEGVEIFHEFDATGPPGKLPWTAPSGSLFHRSETRTMVMSPDWIDDQMDVCGSDRACYDRVMESMKPWQEWARSSPQPTRLVIPLPGWSGDTPQTLSSLMDELAPCDSLATLVWADLAASWQDWAKVVGRQRGSRSGLAGLRWIWLIEGDEDRLLEFDPFFVARTTSSAPARSFLLTRIHAPAARIVIDITSLRDPDSGRLGKSWRALHELSRSLAGLTYQCPVSTSPGDLPRVDSPSRLLTAIFGGAGRHVMVITSEAREKSATRFHPAHPGVLRTPAEDGKDPYADRLVLTPGPIEAETGSMPTIYEELVKLPVECSDVKAITLEQPEWARAAGGALAP